MALRSGALKENAGSRSGSEGETTEIEEFADSDDDNGKDFEFLKTNSSPTSATSDVNLAGEFLFLFFFPSTG